MMIPLVKRHWFRADEHRWIECDDKPGSWIAIPVGWEIDTSRVVVPVPEPDFS